MEETDQSALPVSKAPGMHFLPSFANRNLIFILYTFWFRADTYSSVINHYKLIILSYVTEKTYLDF